ncbi:hypothetical protein C6N75_09790 [Streptomyces solincola]|uniref:Uncharacterized protein n=1 Tax=Streptomyces solincola TaxID=2100817 RepID=A0A2S9PY49_9ACTN|nr:hypothetical protein [Streptomyces solincola]PRH79366.1 hypothetical protein C6N75_09790 [Streptomyces solincola]
MSIEESYVARCSMCGDYMDSLGLPVGSAFDARVFRTWATADKALADAGWHDGHNGDYARCTCGQQPHTNRCRKVAPRLVPLCPPCRSAEPKRVNP